MIAPPSSFPLPVKFPPNVAGSFAKSTVVFIAADDVDTLFEASVAVTVKEKSPSDSSDDEVTEKLPLPSDVVVPIDDPLLIRFIVLFASAVPLIIGVVSLVTESDVVIFGCVGAVSSAVVKDSVVVSLIPA